MPQRSRSKRLRAPILKRIAALAAALAMAGCAAQPQRLAHQGSAGKFNPKYGVATSPRVVADGQPVPVGGGRYQVGKPYRIAGKTYYPSEQPFSATGTASWYGADFHGRRTANGEIFDKSSITAAHPTMPLPSYARVTNLSNNASIIVRVNDRGPYHGGRVMDVSQRVAEALDFKNAGTARVKVEYVSRASLGGSDYGKLLATLRHDGSPANLDGGYFAQPTLIAQNQPAPAAAAPRVEQPRLPPPPPAAAAQPRLPQEIAEAEPQQTASIAARPDPLAKALPPLARAPLPPLRPFDLGTIPGAGVPIAAIPAQTQASLVSYYDSTPIALSDRFEKRGPFEGLKPQQLHPLRSAH